MKWGDAPISLSICTKRTGPMRLTSTAVSSGLSNATAAAEWMTIVAAGYPLPAGVVEPQAIDTNVAGHTGDPLLAEPLEFVVAQLVAQPVEDVVADDLPADALLHAAAAGAHQQHQLHLGHAPKQPLHQCGAQEPGRAGDCQPLARQRIRDHRSVLPNPG